MVFNKWESISHFHNAIKPLNQMATGDKSTVLENSRISPPPGSVVEKSLPLCFLDVAWLLFAPVHQLCFYEIPQCSKSNFTQTIVPNLKHSLSITLQHFFPFAGNLIVFPFTDSTTVPRKPEIRYVDGDSVSLTIAECAKEFGYLTGNHARKADEFYPLVPKLGEITKASEFIKVPVLAIQVTLFPNHGICIGLTNHHAACDGNVRVSFVRAWASISRFGNDKPFVSSGSLPFFDRSVIKDPNGLEGILWRQIAETRIQESPPLHLSADVEKVRSSFIMTRDQINNFKNFVMLRRPKLAHVSSFTVVCAHVWICMAKLHDSIGKQKDEDEREQFGFVADCRARLDPPIPTTYFGNCLTLCTARAMRNQLVGEEGFLNAVEFIGDAIHGRFKSKESIFEGADTVLQELSLSPPTAIGVAGSPKFDIYDTDLGWGKPKKCEIISIDYTLTMSLSVSRESKEDIEIGLSLPKIKMDVFETIFTNEN